MSSKAFRVAIIGTGMITNFAHLPALSLLGSAVEVVGCADIREPAASQTARNYKIPKVYTDSKKMLDELKPDIVLVATPNVSHLEISMLALNSGANVVCEKPVALKHKDAIELFNKAESLGLHFFPAQTYRFFNEQLAVKKIIDEGVLGEIYYAEFDAIRRRGVPKWGFFHMKKHNAGGPFCDLAVHQLDYLLWVLGNPEVLTVSGSKWTKIANTDENLQTTLEGSGAYGGLSFTPRPYDWHEFDVEDMAAGCVRLAGNKLINFKTSWALNLPETYSRRLAGTKAGLSACEDKPITIYGNSCGWMADIQPQVFNNSGLPPEYIFPGHVPLWKNVLGVLSGVEKPIIKKEETLNVTVAVEAFYRSAEIGAEVQCSELK
jgi:predicted dehydrogenase